MLKPGGHIVAFSGTRTYHRLAVAIEDAGFEIRDNLLDLREREKPFRAESNRQDGFEDRRDRPGIAPPRRRQPSHCLARATKIRRRALGENGAVGFRSPRPVTDERPRNGIRLGQRSQACLTEPICLARKPLVGRLLKMFSLMEQGAQHRRCRIHADDARGGKSPLRGCEARSDVDEDRRHLATGRRASNITATKPGRWPANLVTTDHRR